VARGGNSQRDGAIVAKIIKLNHRRNRESPRLRQPIVKSSIKYVRWQVDHLFLSQCHNLVYSEDKSAESSGRTAGSGRKVAAERIVRSWPLGLFSQLVS